MADARNFIRALVDGATPAPPSQDVVAFAAEARRLSPRQLVKPAKPVHAAFVVARLEAVLRDLDEHGDDAEFADDAEFLKKEVVKWKKKSKTSAQLEHFDPRLASEVVAASDFEKLPPAWKKVRAAKSLVKVLSSIEPTKQSPYFAELVGAAICNELEAIAKSSRGEGWQANLDDAPALLNEAVRWRVRFFQPRILAAANQLVARHDHAPTRDALERH
ncbi:MAG: hypothetical protein ACO1OB_07195 [Archangium sp.]